MNRAHLRLPPASAAYPAILGGNSDIVQAVVTALAAHGLFQVVLDTSKPDALSQRLTACPLPITNLALLQWDINENTHLEILLTDTANRLGDIDLVVRSVGALSHASGLSATPASVNGRMSENLTGSANALTETVSDLNAQGHGTIMVIGPVAGLRPRRSNYVYGPAKAGLDAFTFDLQDATTNTVTHIHLIQPDLSPPKSLPGSHLHGSPPPQNASPPQSSGQSTRPTTPSLPSPDRSARCVAPRNTPDPSQTAAQQRPVTTPRLKTARSTSSHPEAQRATMPHTDPRYIRQTGLQWASSGTPKGHL